MKLLLAAILSGLLILSCVPTEQVEALTTGKGLRKIPATDAQTIKALTDAGAEIVVKQPDYLVIRIDGMQSVLSIGTVPLSEADLVQRLVKIQLKDSTSVQTIVDMGIDLWDVEGNEAFAQAYDLYIERLKADGYQVTILEENSRKSGEESK